MRVVQRSAIPRRTGVRTIRSVIFPTLVSRVIRPTSPIPALQAQRTDRRILVTKWVRPRIALRSIRGRVDYPLDAPAVWRYMAKGELDDFPEVVSVEQCRNAINEAEQQRPQKP
jgi:hypothetical protein